MRPHSTWNRLGFWLEDVVAAHKDPPSEAAPRADRVMLVGAPHWLLVLLAGAVVAWQLARGRARGRGRTGLPPGSRHNGRHGGHPLCLELHHRPADPPGRATAVSELTGVIEKAGGLVTGLDVTASGRDRLRVDVTAAARDTGHADEIVEAMRAVHGVEIGKVWTARSSSTSAASSRSSPRCRSATATTCR